MSKKYEGRHYASAVSAPVPQPDEPAAKAAPTAGRRALVRLGRRSRAGVDDQQPAVGVVQS
jgi:hypothetical protein